MFRFLAKGRGQWKPYTPTITHSTPTPNGRSRSSRGGRDRRDGRKSRRGSQAAAARSSTTAVADKAEKDNHSEADKENEQTESHSQPSSFHRAVYRGRGRGRGRGGYSGSRRHDYANGNRVRPYYISVDAETLKSYILQQMYVDFVYVSKNSSTNSAFSCTPTVNTILASITCARISSCVVRLETIMEVIGRFADVIDKGDI